MITRPILIFSEANFGAPLFTPEVSTVCVGLLGLLTVAVLILNAVSSWRRVFGRNPPIEIDLQSKANLHDVNRLEVDIKGFASTKDLEHYQEETRVRSRGLEEQISGLRHELRNECHALKTEADMRAAKNEDAFKDLNSQLRANASGMAGVQKQADMILAHLTNVSAKVDRIAERRAGGA